MGSWIDVTVMQCLHPWYHDRPIGISARLCQVLLNKKDASARALLASEASVACSPIATRCACHVRVTRI